MRMFEITMSIGNETRSFGRLAPDVIALVSRGLDAGMETIIIKQVPNNEEQTGAVPHE